MLTNKQFSAVNRIEGELSPEMAEMAMFSIDIGDCQICTGRDENGKRIMKRAYPRLRGKGEDLWGFKPIRQEETLSEIRKSESQVKAELAEIAKAERIARYAKIAETDPRLQGEREIDPEDNVPLLFDNDGEVELSEDEKFFGLDTELRGGKCRRKGGIKNHGSFEDFVDHS